MASVSVGLAWDGVQDPNVTGYKIRYGTEPGIHPEALSVGNRTSATLTGLQRATRYYIVVVSVDAQGNQSAPSNEVQVLTAQ
jgi:chitodextrinase